MSESEGGSERTRETEGDFVPPPVDRKKRLIAFVALAVFVGFGIFYFGPRMPREMEVRFELPPTLRGGGIELARARATGLSAVIYDADGGRVGTVSMALDGLGAPRTQAAVVQLRPGTYGFSVLVRGSPAGELPMHGYGELSGGESIVELKAGIRQ